MPLPITSQDRQNYEAFFTSWVGSASAAAGLKGALGNAATNALTEQARPGAPTRRHRKVVHTDPYASHYEHTLPPDPYHAMTKELEFMLYGHEAPPSMTHERFVTETLKGMRALLSSHRTIGRIYAANANGVLQHEANVAETVDAMGRWALKTTQSDEKTFDRNWLAIATGFRPTNPFNGPLARWRTRHLYPGELLTASRRSFTTSVQDGQVRVRPRWEPVPYAGDPQEHGCPAVGIHIPGEGGREIPGLRDVVHTLGVVVLERIYPHVFPMTRDGVTPLAAGHDLPAV